MNTKSFAQQARRILMKGVRDKLRYWGFDQKGNAQDEPAPLPGGYQFRGEVFDDPAVPAVWQSLRRAIKHKGYDTVVEEAAYTWFNRFMAIRILSKNGYEPPMLDFTDGVGRTPAILQLAKRGTAPFLNETEKKRLQRIITDGNRDSESFAILLIGYCHTHTLLQTVFGSIDDYTELLLPDDILAQYSEKAHVGFLDLLHTTDAISDEEYRKVELIGWLYQFYISEKKDEVFAGFKKNKKAEAEDIPAATQIFTPNWIVKYMVQNTVGKIWLDLHPNSPLKTNMKYLVESDHYGDPIVQEAVHLKLLDPAVGSGHILVEGFDLLYDMYMAEYYPPEEAVESILRHNLFGLDIDRRAAQLAQFAVLLKAAARYPDILKKGIRPQIYAMPEPHEFSRQDVLDFLGKDGLAYADHLFRALHLMQQAQNLGSIMQFELPESAVDYIAMRWKHLMTAKGLSFHEKSLMPALSAYLPILVILCKKYEAVVANPPYMGQKNMNNVLKNYVNEFYDLGKQDLYSAFIERIITGLATTKGLVSFITPPSWMFASTYHKLRLYIINKFTLTSLLNLGRGIFGVDFGTSSFVICNERIEDFLGTYRNLFREKVTVDSSEQKKEWFLDKKYKFYKANQNDFLKINGNPIAFWIPNKVFDIFVDTPPLENFLEAKQGLATADNDRFRRSWHEVSQGNISFEGYVKNKKWFPYNSGGQFRKWYGNHDYVVNWENEGMEIKGFKDENGDTKSRAQNVSFYFKHSASWSKMTASGLAFRYYPEGFIFDVSGCSAFGSIENEYYLTGLLNSVLKVPLIESINQSFNYEVGQINSTPFKIDTSFQKVLPLVKTCIFLSKNDWDCRETSWFFTSSPLLNSQPTLRLSHSDLIKYVSSNFFQLQSVEEELNRIFIGIYGLQDELTPEVPLKDITILQEELNSKDLEALEEEFRSKSREGITLPIRRDVVMQQFISYLIGVCMGRYRLDQPGLHIAHPNPTDEEIANYTWNGQEVEIDDDAILPLMGSASEFPDDAFQRIKQLLDVIWGEHTRTENLNFLQECLDMDLEKYLVKNCWKDHCKRYKKKPIYWLFSSPGGAFQVLVYMHRMNAFTVERIREKYLLPHIKHLRSKISMMESRSAQLTSQEARQLDRHRNELLECEQYEMLIKGVADRQIVFDLDDGVTVNYALFDGVVAPVK